MAQKRTIRYFFFCAMGKRFSVSVSFLLFYDTLYLLPIKEREREHNMKEKMLFRFH